MDIESKIIVKDIDKDLFSNLMSHEDFDFKTKNISVTFNETSNNLEINIKCDSSLDLKIAITAIHNSLKVIDKTLNTIK